ncbi:hypothetical protein [Xanthomonas perforans]|uniref:hypothetical protein n=1 Tax=Xanthomonas perforans TaxID=442694 RepID=UPI0012DB2C5F|nr:hypothetical protein [Xanthomonas perforans]
MSTWIDIIRWDIENKRLEEAKRLFERVKNGMSESERIEALTLLANAEHVRNRGAKGHLRDREFATTRELRVADAIAALRDLGDSLEIACAKVTDASSEFFLGLYISESTAKSYYHKWHGKVKPDK